MISRRRMLAAKVHLPLRQLALCLDCDECFEISSPDVPSLRERNVDLARAVPGADLVGASSGAP